MSLSNERTRRTIVVTGGGSGGHITPVLAVAHQLKMQDPEYEVIYIGQTGDSLGDIPTQHASIDKVLSVRAGKFRRYHGEGIKQLLDVPTTLKNIRDVGFVVTGYGQSLRLLKRIKPDVVFIKGGFVGVPVGLAAASLKIPIVTHDSDALPGLANRIIAPWATYHAVALPKEVYAYPQAKTVTVGVPISHEFRTRSDSELQALRDELGFKAEDRVILITGGGLGARRLNNAVQLIAADILAEYPDVQIVHLAGRTNADEVTQFYDSSLSDLARGRVRVMGYAPNLYAYGAVATIVVTRAGGTSLAEFAAQGKACIVVPNPHLTGGHQTINARTLLDRQAIRLVSETELGQNPKALAASIKGLLDDDSSAQEMSRRLLSLAQPNAAEHLAMLLLDVAQKHTNNSGSTHHEPVQKTD